MLRRHDATPARRRGAPRARSRPLRGGRRGAGRRLLDAAARGGHVARQSPGRSAAPAGRGGLLRLAGWGRPGPRRPGAEGAGAQADLRRARRLRRPRGASGYGGASRGERRIHRHRAARAGDRRRQDRQRVEGERRVRPRHRGALRRCLRRGRRGRPRRASGLGEGQRAPGRPAVAAPRSPARPRARLAAARRARLPWSRTTPAASSSARASPWT